MPCPIIGIDSFSFHRFFGEVNQWEKPVEENWSVANFIDFAADFSQAYGRPPPGFERKDLDGSDFAFREKRSACSTGLVSS